MRQLTQKFGIYLNRIVFNSCKCRSFASEAQFKTSPYSLHHLENGPSAEVTLTKTDALTFYERMATIRKMENEISKLYKQKLIRGFCHLYAGEEAVAVGVHTVLRPVDTIIASYRNHSWAYLYHDQSMDPVIGELVGVKCGSAKGRGGSMHMYAKNFYGGQGIVGAQVPLGVGIGFAHKYRKSEGFSVTIYGDGAANNGQVFEVFNMAKLWNLPVLFLCENNLFGMGTRVDRVSANPNLYSRGDLIPGVLVDGMDVLSVREATRFASEHISSGKGPIILEARTYRYFGHSVSDPGTSYRTREEIKEVRDTRDPITTFKNKITTADLVTEAEISGIEKKIKKELEDCVKKVVEDKPLVVEEIANDIYSNSLEKEARGVSPFKGYKYRGKVANK